jgi:rubredoxin
MASTKTKPGRLTDVRARAALAAVGREGRSAMLNDCRICPQCKSTKTIALNERFRRCKECRHVYEPGKYQTRGAIAK